MPGGRLLRPWASVCGLLFTPLTRHAAAGLERISSRHDDGRLLRPLASVCGLLFTPPTRYAPLPSRAWPAAAGPNQRAARAARRLHIAPGSDTAQAAAPLRGEERDSMWMRRGRRSCSVTCHVSMCALRVFLPEASGAGRVRPRAHTRCVRHSREERGVRHSAVCARAVGVCGARCCGAVGSAAYRAPAPEPLAPIDRRGALGCRGRRCAAPGARGEARERRPSVRRPRQLTGQSRPLRQLSRGQVLQKGSRY